MVYSSCMEAVKPSEAVSIGSLFAGYVLPQPTQKKRTSERAELVRYFFEHAAPAWTGKRQLTKSYMGFKLAHLSLYDLYSFKSMCIDRERSGYSWSKFFWGALKEQPWQQ